VRVGRRENGLPRIGIVDNKCPLTSYAYFEKNRGIRNKVDKGFVNINTFLFLR